jgi:hypothetical protein
VNHQQYYFEALNSGDGNFTLECASWIKSIMDMLVTLWNMQCGIGLCLGMKKYSMVFGLIVKMGALNWIKEFKLG